MLGEKEYLFLFPFLSFLFSLSFSLSPTFSFSFSFSLSLNFLVLARIISFLISSFHPLLFISTFLSLTFSLPLDLSYSLLCLSTVFSSSFFVAPSFSFSLAPSPPRVSRVRRFFLPLITGRGRRASKRNPVRTVVVPCGRTWIIVGCYRDTECTGW